MIRRPSLLGTSILGILLVVVGCRPQIPNYLHEDGDLSHYVGMATSLDAPDVMEPRLSEVEGALRPFSLENTEAQEIWDLPLEEAVQITLKNSKVIRLLPTAANVQLPPELLTTNPQGVATVYEPAITESNPRLGVEAALAAFDTQFTSSVFWEKNDTPRNTFIFGGQELPAFPQVNKQDLGTFQAQLQKTAATGGTWAIRHNVQYDKQNSSRLFPSDWNVNVEAEMRQPLLQGAGVQFNRIAGPGSIPGFNNGVIIARINTDIALATFETNVRDMVYDVELAYWELYFAYRNLDAVISGRDSALQTWRRIHALFEQGARGGEAEKEAQAREQYFLFRSSMEQALNTLYQAESKLRYIMGLAATDGRLIRPADEPTTANVAFDWHGSLGESLCRRAELRQQRWQVKRREMELIAAKNYLLPRLDAVARYRWLGLGDDLIDSQGGSGNPIEFDSNAYQSMTGGEFQEWRLGLELSVPLGFRKELAGVRSAQLSLARERAVLQDMELEISHQLAFAVRDLETNHVLAETNFNRAIAAQRQVDAVAAAYDAGTITLDVLLETQRRLAQAKSDYYRTLVNFNVSIADVHYRKGTLLEYNGVCLAEGPWPAKAYFDAKRLARARDASFYLDYGFTRPNVISRGPIPQRTGRAMMPPLHADEELEPTRAERPEGGPETIPTPEPLDSYDDSDLPEPPEPVPSLGPQTRTNGPAMGNSRAMMPRGRRSHVQAAGYQSPQRNPLANGSKRHETRPHPSAAEAYWPASGGAWVQR